MTAKEFLSLPNCPVKREYIAHALFPQNKSSKTYLSVKLSETHGKKWTATDEINAVNALHDLGIELSKIG